MRRALSDWRDILVIEPPTTVMFDEPFSVFSGFEKSHEGVGKLGPG